MTKKEVMNYVTETPHNVNKNILGQKLDEFQKNVSWNDLKDKPFYSEEAEVIIFPEKEFTFEPWAGDYRYHDVIADDFKLVAGNKYDVIFDGTKYECTAYQIGINDVALGRYLSSGNQDLPFSLLFVEFPDYEIFFDKTLRFSIPTPAETVSHTLEIRTVNETIKTIEPKYLPGPDLVIRSNAFVNDATKDNISIVSGSVEAVYDAYESGKIPVVEVEIIAGGSYIRAVKRISGQIIFYGDLLWVDFIDSGSGGLMDYACRITFDSSVGYALTGFTKCKITYTNA